MSKVYNVGVIGGGVSGAVTALQLADLGIENVFFEQKDSLVNGPPFCHLHAGGNLYPDISDEQCRKLMKQSIDMAKLFPQSIDERPTFISIPKTEKYEVETIERRLKMLVSYYKELVKEDPTNEILGAPDDYYKIYTSEHLESLSEQPTVAFPTTPDEWMGNAIKLIDHKQLKMPVILVQEYGWNLFRLGAQAQLALQKSDKCDLHLGTKIEGFKDVSEQKLGHNWEIYSQGEVFKVNYLVNSCGFKTGELDQSLDLKVERLIEFKASYVSKWDSVSGLIPELIFHGERGTPNGMAQLTPYYGDYYQIHGMTKDITLFDKGLVKSEKSNAQPEFQESITQKLTKGWSVDETKIRTEKAIDFVAKFVPSFKSATVGGPPLFGAQQIPGDDPDLRVGEVRFPYKSYARSEIVKASSALVVANQIISKIYDQKIISTLDGELNHNNLLESITESEIDVLAAELAVKRGYPEALSRLLVEKKGMVADLI